jgi:hypothetical protein
VAPGSLARRPASLPRHAPPLPATPGQHTLTPTKAWQPQNTSTRKEVKENQATTKQLKYRCHTAGDKTSLAEIEPVTFGLNFLSASATICQSEVSAKSSLLQSLTALRKICVQFSPHSFAMNFFARSQRQLHN